jgi:NDP-sugar pyrophosphorylase family protein
MLEAPGLLFAMQSGAYWLDIGTPQKYLEAQLDVAAGRLGTPPAPGAVERSGGGWVQPGAVIAETATIVGPSVIGPEARVEAGAHVEASILGHRARVGENATVLRSVLYSDVSIGAGDGVKDEVVGVDVVLPCA